ncbi:MAG TPA: hypothetical protein VKU40_10560 [Thermoanaerobaculia bacterium]|nr:hypothetical protein [Thermoanaerobaculia bacterium]
MSDDKPDTVLKRGGLLKEDLAFYNRNLPEWGEHEGKYALIHGAQLFDFYDSYEDAIKVGYAEFGLTPFLVKQVHMVEQVQFVSRLVAPELAGV